MLELVFAMAIGIAAGAVAGSLYYNEPISAVFDFERE
jgi:hypothetical protein